MLDTSTIPWPWFGVAITVALVLLGLAERFNDSPVIGWVGKLFRWLGRKQYERENAETIMLRRDLETMQARMTTFERNQEAQNIEIEARDRYMVYMAEWARDVRILIASVVPPLSLPEYMSFLEWRAKNFRCDDPKRTGE